MSKKTNHPPKNFGTVRASDWSDAFDAGFIIDFNRIQRRVYENSVSKGFWKASSNIGEKIALTHTELSEALEGIRRGDPEDDKIPEFTCGEAELADTIIRIMDLAQKQKYRLAEAIIAKIKFNSTRSYLHGKKF